MSERDNGGPAFPGGMVSVGDGDHQPFATGMTLRDWFAGQALVGFLQASADDAFKVYPPSISERCFAYADAMLEARK